MKTWLTIAVAAALLTGCATSPVFTEVVTEEPKVLIRSMSDVVRYKRGLALIPGGTNTLTQDFGEAVLPTQKRTLYWHATALWIDYLRTVESIPSYEVVTTNLLPIGFTWDHPDGDAFRMYYSNRPGPKTNYYQVGDVRSAIFPPVVIIPQKSTVRLSWPGQGQGAIIASGPTPFKADMRHLTNATGTFIVLPMNENSRFFTANKRLIAQ